MAENMAPAGEGNDFGHPQQGRVPNKIRKGNLPELRIPTRQAVVNNHHLTRTKSNHAAAGVVKGTSVLPSKQSSGEQELQEPERNRIKGHDRTERTRSREEVGKVPAARKKESTFLGRIFRFSVCLGRKGRAGKSERQNQKSADGKTSNFTKEKKHSKGRNSKGGKKRARGRPAESKSSENSKLQQDASKQYRSCDSHSQSFGSRRNSSAGVGQKRTTGSWARTTSASRSVSRLRDYYVQVMLKMADMSNQHGSGIGVGLGVHVDSESRTFESEIFRKKSSQEADMVEHYWQNSIRPDEWNDAKMENRVARHFSL